MFEGGGFNIDSVKINQRDCSIYIYFNQNIYSEIGISKFEPEPDDTKLYFKNIVNVEYSIHPHFTPENSIALFLRVNLKPQGSFAFQVWSHYSWYDALKEYLQFKELFDYAMTEKCQ